MNHESPNSLGEILRLSNADVQCFNIIESNGSHYVTESSVVSFMEDNNLSNTQAVLEAIKNERDINDITLINEDCEDESLNNLNTIMTIYESLNPFSTISAAKGYSELKAVIGKINAKISKQKYDEPKEVKKCIDKCDKALKDIQEEKSKLESVDSKKVKKADLKFSLAFTYNIAKELFFDVVLPLVIDKKLGLTNALAFKNKKLAKGLDIANYALTGYDVFNKTSGDFKNLYLSLTDYRKLLNEYETKINDTKASLENQYDNLISLKEMSSMVELKEDFAAPGAVDVKYYSPEELKLQNNHTPAVLHDEKDNVEQPEMEIPAPEVEPPKADTPVASEPQPPVEVPSEPIPAEQPTAAPVSCPMDAIKQVNQDPHNVPIACYGDKYYIDHNALRCYMDACGHTKYESALEEIIAAHNDPKFCAESVRVVMKENDLNSLDPKVKESIEESSVEFDIYG